MTKYKFNVDHSNPQDEKKYAFGKEMKFDLKQVERPSTRDRSPIKWLESSDIITSGVSTVLLPEKPCTL